MRTERYLTSKLGAVVTALLATLILVACQQSQTPAPAPTSPMAEPRVASTERVFVVFEGPWAIVPDPKDANSILAVALTGTKAMAVSEGKISCIGKMDHVLLDCGGGQEGAETVNLHGQFVMPGFNDAHVHLGGAGADALAVPLVGVSSAEEMQKRVAEAVAHHKPGEWIAGGGWDHTMWAEKRFPNRQQLDTVSPKNP
jgi:hypothetical protein